MLHICPTPIGNLGDITLRVLETLRQADLVAAEDTRRTRQLLTHFGISKPLVSFYEHNEVRRLPELLKRLAAGDSIALVSDAGMPGICDPGYRLIAAALDAGLPVDVLPGPSAIETALVSSGFATDSFIFLGYLPRKKGDLTKTLEEIAAQPRTCVAFETPHRLRGTLAAAAPLLVDRPLAVCRELTKKFQEITRGTATELAAGLPEKVKGEIVLVFGPVETEAEKPSEDQALRDILEMTLAAGLSARRASDLAVLLTGAPRKHAYQLALELKT
jgi:16S rRNA (cytidine1402-2'-O)-methyltransferase